MVLEAFIVCDYMDISKLPRSFPKAWSLTCLDLKGGDWPSRPSLSNLGSPLRSSRLTRPPACLPFLLVAVTVCMWRGLRVPEAW